MLPVQSLIDTAHGMGMIVLLDVVSAVDWLAGWCCHVDSVQIQVSCPASILHSAFWMW